MFFIEFKGLKLIICIISSGLFKGIEEYYSDNSMGYINWVDENCIVYMELMLEMYLLSIETNTLYIPTQIQQLQIDGPNHLKFKSKSDKISIRVLKESGSVQ